jgi:hypothetical protein
MLVEFKSICLEAMLNKAPDLVLMFINKGWVSHLDIDDKIKR